MPASDTKFDPAKMSLLRRDRGLTQRALAIAAGVSQSLVAELERGKHPPSESSLTKIAAALSVDSGSFFDQTLPN
jgi:transcriptional regulator with XRE-family HTH domain